MKKLVLLSLLFISINCFAMTDWDCMNDCENNYSVGYCQRVCEY